MANYTLKQKILLRAPKERKQKRLSKENFSKKNDDNEQTAKLACPGPATVQRQGCCDSGLHRESYHTDSNTNGTIGNQSKGYRGWPTNSLVSVIRAWELIFKPTVIEIDH